MEDHRLRSYCLVVETKSFSRAAQAKHMTQSAMSRLVKSLEDELGVKLLHRKGKVALPTAEGRLFYEHARNILENYARMEQDISAATNTAKGALRLGASRTRPSIFFLRCCTIFPKNIPTSGSTSRCARPRAFSGI